MRREGFCAGFQYGLAVRANAFQCNMIRQETNCFPNVSRYSKKMAEEEIAEAGRRDKNQYIDNPYIMGGAQAQFDPHTGLKKAIQPQKGGHKPAPRGSNTQGRQKSQLEPYSQGGSGNSEEDQYRPQNGNNTTRHSKGPQRPREQDNRTQDQVKGYKTQQGAPQGDLRLQGKPT